jgi:hypothetical protein
VDLLAVLLLLQLSQTEAFKTHFFFDSDASLTDVLTLSPKLNTARRREAWPALIKACSEAPSPATGWDPLRTTGLVGSILFLGFFLTAGRTPACWRSGARTANSTRTPGCWSSTSSRSR